MTVHVSLHDVAPCWKEQVELAVELCRHVDVKPALLVVPNFHGKTPLLEDPGFCRRLQGWQGEGHEIYLHGYYHQSGHDTAGVSRVSLRRWMAQNVVSQGEAEFSDVAPAEAHRRIIAGRQVLESARLSVQGFVAPAWSYRPWLLPLLAREGFAFTENRTRVYDPARGRSRWSLVLNYASRTPGRLLSTVAYCRAAKHAQPWVPLRLAIHPADLNYQLLRRELQKLLAEFAGSFVARGRDLLDA